MDSRRLLSPSEAKENRRTDTRYWEAFAKHGQAASNAHDQRESGNVPPSKSFPSLDSFDWFSSCASRSTTTMMPSRAPSASTTPARPPAPPICARPPATPCFAAFSSSGTTSATAPANEQTTVFLQLPANRDRSEYFITRHKDGG
ncbi:hypothetical protein C8R45DRAFT_1096390 [Mycena sanguinolenta]|nr:hypothetical protein C8R45DRAFT_1096390 [Mycena sanguinolenta]